MGSVRAPSIDATVRAKDRRRATAKAKVRVYHANRGGNFMKYALSISAALLLALCQGQPASAQPSQRPALVHNLVNDAVTALGGADALRNLKAIRSEERRVGKEG